MRYLVFCLMIASVLACSRKVTPAVVLPDLETRADSLAMATLDAHGGAARWAAVPHIRFEFARSTDGERDVVARHFWSREDGDYRLEWPAQDEDTYVALFNVKSGVGRVYLNGAPVSGERHAALLEQAHRRFTEDTFWMLAPVRFFEPGVRRTWVADSSNADTDVLHVRFDGDGPAVRSDYWFYIDRISGKVSGWAFVPDGSPDAPAVHYEWLEYRDLPGRGGTVRVATRKQAVGEPTAILTDRIEVPRAVPEGMFTDPRPLLDDEKPPGAEATQNNATP
jgi:hypothetical protein